MVQKKDDNDHTDDNDNKMQIDHTDDTDHKDDPNHDDKDDPNNCCKLVTSVILQTNHAIATSCLNMLLFEYEQSTRYNHIFIYVYSHIWLCAYSHI